MARVNALLRRTTETISGSVVFCIGETEFNLKKYEALKSGKEITYTSLEFQMVSLLYQKKGEVVTREDFLNRVWGENNTVVTERTIDSHIGNIRKKLEDDASNPKYILSVRGVGYKLSS